MKILTTPFRIVVVFVLVLLNSSVSVFSQSGSKDFKNSIKFNVSNTLLYDNSYQFSYERIIKENQSINVFVGYQEFPLLSVDLDNVNFEKKSDRTGFSVGADYRFYLGSVNKYSAPRGVYLAPFISFFQFSTDRDLIYNSQNSGTSSANLSSKFNLTNIGGELGYQFVLWDRFVIDCVLFGPSLTRYKFNLKLDSDVSSDLDENEVYQKVIEAIKNKFPGIDGITGDEGIERKGVQSVTAIGFRYNISIGYRF